MKKYIGIVAALALLSVAAYLVLRKSGNDTVSTKYEDATRKWNAEHSKASSVNLGCDDGLTFSWQKNKLDYDCADFHTHAQAQCFFEEHMGDPYGLDADKDGVACETLP